MGPFRYLIATLRPYPGGGHGQRLGATAPGRRFQPHDRRRTGLPLLTGRGAAGTRRIRARDLEPTPHRNRPLQGLCPLHRCLHSGSARPRRVARERPRLPPHPARGRGSVHELRAMRARLPGLRLHGLRGAQGAPGDGPMTIATIPPHELHHGHRVLMKGNEAMAEAAIRAGCDAYFGYPITPQAELLEWMARRMPEEGRPFVQAESELGAINMALGAAATGARVLVSSSSPGISLIGEAMALMADAFELAEKYRTPVFILADGTLGQAMEPVELTFREPARLANDWALSGADGRPPRVVKSMHLEPENLEVHNQHLQAKFAEIAAREVRWAGENLDGAELVIVAYGTAARVARTAIARARDDALKVGLFRPITLWPFPSAALAEVAAQARGVLVVELSAGQLVEDVRLAIEGRRPVAFEGRTGGMVPTPGEVLDALRRLRGVAAANAAPTKEARP